MKAAYYERLGPPDEVLQVGEIPDPRPGPGEVRVRLRWSGINPSDVKQRAGRGMAAMPFPRIVPHSDGMGVIDAVGPQVDDARVGQKVWVWNAAYGRQYGTAAQYVVLPQAQAVPLPDGVPDEVGACMGIPAQTAVHAVLTDGGVAGKRVLVAGGAGAVGYYAVQAARLLGATDVIATVSSAEKAAIAVEAGATLCIDYRTEVVAQRVLDATKGEGVDRVIEVDVAGNSKVDLEVLKERGTWVCYGSSGGRVHAAAHADAQQGASDAFLQCVSAQCRCEGRGDHPHSVLACSRQPEASGGRALLARERRRRACLGCVGLGRWQRPALDRLSRGLARHRCP